MTQPNGSLDAAQALAAAAGDQRALAAIYDRYSGRLLGFCVSMLRNRADAEDCLQDVFVIAATRLRDLREPALLRSWLFSVARHECLARIDKRKKEVPVDEVPDRATVDVDIPSSMALDAELAALLRDAQAGLSERDRLLLELADRQQLSGEEFAKAIGVPRSTAYTLLARARTTACRSIGALLVARAGRDQCETLDRLLAGWDGQLTTLRRKQIARHIESCEVCSERERRIASPAALLGEGRAYAMDLVALRSRILSAAALAAPPTHAWRDGWPPADRLLSRPRKRRRIAVAGAAAALLLVIAAIGASLSGVGGTVNGAGRAATTPVPTSAASVTAAPISAATVPPTSPTPSRTAASTVTVTRVVVVPPPSSPSASDSATRTTSAPVTTWTLTVDVASSVVINGKTFKCSTRVCTFPVVDKAAVEVEAQEPLQGNPLTCASSASGDDCSFTMTANDEVSEQPIIQ
jgi:RNA polymerase sigma factor (sigma-70 family)